MNGRWIGVHRNPDELKKALLKLRRAESISNDVSIVYDHSLNEIRVNNDWGRVCRPLFVVEQGQIKLTKQEVKQIKVRYHLHSTMSTLVHGQHSLQALHLVPYL